MRFVPVFNREPGPCRYRGHDYRPDPASFRDDFPGFTCGTCGGGHAGWFGEAPGRWECATTRG